MRKKFLWLLVFAAALTLSPLTALAAEVRDVDLSHSKVTVNTDGSLILTVKGAAPIPMQAGDIIRVQPLYWHNCDAREATFTTEAPLENAGTIVVSEIRLRFTSAYTIKSDGLDIKIDNIKLPTDAEPSGELDTYLNLVFSTANEYIYEKIPFVLEDAPRIDLSRSKVTVNSDDSMTLNVRNAAAIQMNVGDTIQFKSMDYWDLAEATIDDTALLNDESQGNSSQMLLRFKSGYTIPNGGLDIKINNVKLSLGAAPSDMPHKAELTLSDNTADESATEILNVEIDGGPDISGSRMVVHADGTWTLELRSVIAISVEAGNGFMLFPMGGCWDHGGATITTEIPLRNNMGSISQMHLVWTDTYIIPSGGIDIKFDNIEVYPDHLPFTETSMSFGSNRGYADERTLPFVIEGGPDVSSSRVTVHSDDSVTLRVRSATDIPMKAGDTLSLSHISGGLWSYLNFYDATIDTTDPLEDITDWNSEKTLKFTKAFTIPGRGGLDVKINNVKGWDWPLPSYAAPRMSLVLHDRTTNDIITMGSIPVVREMKLSGDTTIDLQGDVEVDQDGKITLLDAGALVVTGDGSLIELPSGSTIKSEGAATASASAFAFRVLADESSTTTIVVGPDGGLITYGASGATEHLNGGAIVTIGPDGVPTVTNNETSVTLKVSFQGRPSEPSNANVEKLAVKWIKDGAAIGQGETVFTEDDGTTPISLPPTD